MTETIAQLDVFKLKLPLTTPYKLSLGKVTHFDTLLAKTTTDSGQVGLGEATFLTRYTQENLDGGWELSRSLAKACIGKSLQAAWSTLDSVRARHPFTVTQFMTGIEQIRLAPVLNPPVALHIPLLALVQGNDESELTDQIDGLLKLGYQTLKIKVGFDVATDLENVALIQKINRGRAALRIDANQGYDKTEACEFVSRLSPQNVELLEQTCVAGDWESAVAVAKMSTVPLMLDESIYDLADIEKAARLGATTFVKLKLMKFGSLSHLMTGLERIRALGLEPVLGNGVAGDVGCWMEACVAHKWVSNAGEMNGFLKPVVNVLDNPLTVSAGAIHVPANYQPQLQLATVMAYAQAHETYRI